MAALRDYRRTKNLDARPAERTASYSVHVPRPRKGFYGNRFSARETRTTR